MAQKSKTRTFSTSGHELPRKRAKLDETSKPKPKSQPTSFKTVDELQAALDVQHPDALAKGALTTIRNQLTLKQSELPISPADARLTTVQQWMGRAPGASDLFKLWEKTDPKQNALISLIVSVLSSILGLLSCNYTCHALGTPIIKALLTPQWTKKINSYVGGPHTDLLLSTFKLLNAMSSFASGKERKSVLESFPWEMKNLPRLLNMRRKGKSGEQVDVLDKPDIRTLYAFLLISFIDSDASTQVKSTFLEQHRDALLAVFKGLHQDPYPVVRRVLEICWSGLWSDPKIKRTVKIGLFNEITIGHLLKLYDRPHAEDDDPEHVPADLAHHFLLAICTRPGQGICFKDRGWYPPEVDGAKTREDDPEHEESQDRRKGGRIYNKILANVLKNLKANEDPRQQELTLKILTACPELVAGYWSGAGLTLEPRLSSKWIANISLFGTIISLSIPTTSFLLPAPSNAPSSSSTNANVDMYQPTPPPLSTIIENILPSVNTKNHFSKGLQSNNGLVMHCTALALSKCLIKYQRVREVFRKIADSLQEVEQDAFTFFGEEDEGKEGQWRKRLRDIEREVRRRVPDFQVVVAFLHRAEDGQKGETGKEKGKEKEQMSVKPNASRKALLGEVAHRLLWLYQSCLPDTVAEARFDVGKLLGSIEVSKGLVEEMGGSQQPSDRMHGVKQLHILRLLGANDQFSWSAKGSSSKHTNLYILLNALALSRPPITQVLTSLLERMLSNSVLFQDSPDEPSLWLACLPQIQRPSNGSAAPDGVVLTDEVQSVVAFLDDCIQRCSKTPYRYIDELHAMLNDVASLDSSPHQATVSPLLVTVLEQLTIKVTNKLLSPSDVLALSTFVRKLVLKLSCQTDDLRFLRAFACKVDDALNEGKLFGEYPVVSRGIRREVGILLHCLKYQVGSSQNQSVSMEATDDTTLSDVENHALPNAIKAFELIDYVRLIGKPLRAADVLRIASLVSQLHPPALLELSEQLHPSERLVWDAMDLSPGAELANNFIPSFHILLFNSNQRDLTDPIRRDVLVSSAFAHSSKVLHLKHVIRAICHALASSEGQEQVVESLLSLVGSISERASSTLSAADYAALKEFIFVEKPVLKVCFERKDTSTGMHDALRRIIGVSLDPTNESDRCLASELAAYWIHALRASISAGDVINNLAITWIKYAPSSDVFALFDILYDSQHHDPTLLEGVLDALRVMKSVCNLDLNLQKRLPQLLALSNRLPGSSLTADFVEMALCSKLPVGHDGLVVQNIQSSQVTIQWKQRLDRLPADVNPLSYLQNITWSPSTAKIICHAIYSHDTTASQQAISDWIRSDGCQQRPIGEVAPVFYAYLDCRRCSNLDVPEQDSHIWFPQVSKLAKAVVDTAMSEELRDICSTCVHLLVIMIPTKRSELVANIVKEVKRLSTSSLSKELLSVGLRCSTAKIPDASDLVDAIVDHSLEWAVRLLAEGAYIDSEDQRVLHVLVRLLESVKTVKSHLAEPVLVAVVQHRLHNTLALKLLTALLPKAHLKPIVVNRHLQGIVQNPYFFKLCSSPSPELNDIRAAIVDVLHILFNLHPANTCQPSHVEPLVPLYRGTVSLSDRKLLSIFLLFEVRRKTSIASLLSQWSATPGTASSGAMEAFQSVDSIVVLRTCLHFPQWRTYEDDCSTQAQEENIYDPVFLILLFAHVLVEDPPTTAFAWVELFRTNIVGLLIRGLSAKDEQIRELAASQIAVLWKSLQNADMQEKPHVFLILGLLRDAVMPSDGEVPVRLPSYTTLLLAHALRGVFYPSNFVYPLTARFLLQRPRLDVNDVPMLYNMLFSSGDHWKKDRAWIIRFLADGMQSTADWRVFKRRHTWDLLASMFQSSENDIALRKGILEVLANLTCIPQATNSLVLKSNLLTWIEMQLLDPKDEECVAWLKILENIIMVVDKEKAEKATDGEWRAWIGRCIFSLLDKCKSMSVLPMLHLTSRVLLRLSLLPGKHIPNIERLITKTVQVMPDEVDAGNRLLSGFDATRNTSPHTSFRLHEKETVDQERVWGKTIEAFWRVSMTFERKSTAWDFLTARLLVWRSAVGQDKSPIGEWARQQVVYALPNPP
ncbi:hypothetical protein VKT23_017290 [Stygiomarasmius scandens]|uniref:Nucleolar pre-ribosomal-associated protein 1 n=1 Tax=Marasmiellus scandens TaxID=2682957 RepID=A0ABR1ISQ5_9AGAR